jgi:hypothetical protein
VKKVVAILFSFALLLPQSFFIGGATAQAAAAETGKCGCESRKCCVNKSTPESSPLPLAPVRSNSPSQSIWLQIWAAATLTLPAPPVSKLSPVTSFIPILGAVPLYQQTCAYLL